MATSLRLFHGQHWSLDEPLADGEATDGPDVFTVETATGPSYRRRQKVKHKGHTDIDMPDGYPGSSIEWAHFEQAITQRHAATAWVKTVAMRPGGDEAIAKRVAAVFEADLVEWEGP